MASSFDPEPLVSIGFDRILMDFVVVFYRFRCGFNGRSLSTKWTKGLRYHQRTLQYTGFNHCNLSCLTGPLPKGPNLLVAEWSLSL